MIVPGTGPIAGFNGYCSFKFYRINLPDYFPRKSFSEYSFATTFPVVFHYWIFIYLFIVYIFNMKKSNLTEFVSHLQSNWTENSEKYIGKNSEWTELYAKFIPRHQNESISNFYRYVISFQYRLMRGKETGQQKYDFPFLVKPANIFNWNSPGPISPGKYPVMVSVCVSVLEFSKFYFHILYFNWK